MRQTVCRNTAGFTLIEILSVLLLIGIMAAVALPRMDPANVNVSTAAATVETDIRFTQELALSRNPATVGAIGVTFTNGASSYTITDPGGLFTQTRNLPSGVAITSPTTTISFNKYGQPEFATASVSIELTAGAEKRQIIVERITGRVSKT